MRIKFLGQMAVIGLLSILCVGCGIKKTGASVNATEKPTVTPTKDVVSDHNNSSDIKSVLVGSSSAKISIGQSKEDVIKSLGEPSKTSNPEVWEADGLEHQNLTYDKEGIDISFVKRDDVFIVSIININESSKAKTCDNIMIGSTKDEITSAYKGHIDDSNMDDNTVVIGSMYDGIVIKLDNNRAASIVVGAAAE